MNFFLPKVLSQPGKIEEIIKEFREYALKLTGDLVLDQKEAIFKRIQLTVKQLLDSGDQSIAITPKHEFKEILPRGKGIVETVAPEVKQNVRNDEDLTVETTVWRLCMYPAIAENCPKDLIESILKSVKPDSLRVKDGFIRLACVCGNKTMVSNILSCPNISIEEPEKLLYLSSLHGSSELLQILFRQLDFPVGLATISGCLQKSMVLNKDPEVSRFLWDQLMSMEAPEDERCAVISDFIEMMFRYYAVAKPPVGKQSWRTLSKGHDEIIKEMVAADPNGFVRDGLGGALRFWSKVGGSVMSSASDPELSLGEFLVKSLLETDNLHWKVAERSALGSDVGVGSLPGKLIKEKNERVFKVVWPYVEKYCPGKTQALRTWAIQLDSLEGYSVNGPRQQMFDWHDLSEKLFHCSFDDYVKEVKDLVKKVYPSGEVPSQIQSETVTYTNFLQSSAAIKESSKPDDCSVDIIKKLCMLPRLSLKSMGKWIPDLLASCSLIQKRECLRLAAERGNLQMIEVLLGRGGLDSAHELDVVSPLYMAVLCGHEQAAMSLISARGNPMFKGVYYAPRTYIPFGVMIQKFSDFDVVKYAYKALKDEHLKSRMCHNMSIVGLTVNRLIEDREQGKPVGSSQLEMLLSMIRRSPSMFFEKENERQGRPIERLLKCKDPIFDALKRDFITATDIDWRYFKQQRSDLKRQSLEERVKSLKGTNLYQEIMSLVGKYKLDAHSNESTVHSPQRCSKRKATKSDGDSRREVVSRSNKKQK